MVAELCLVLRAACEGADLKVLFAPVDVILGSSVVEPDLLVAPACAFTERDLPGAPLLVVEARSPSTAWLDQGRKRALYEEHGVAHYWLADPSEPSLTVLDLVDGRYVETGHVIGDESIAISAPFAVTLNPATLAGRGAG